MTNIIKKIKDKWFRVKTNSHITPFLMEGVTVIHFTTHGCMGTIHNFDYIGTIVSITYPKHCDGSMFYKVKVLKDKTGYELRDNLDDIRYEEVPSWYLQDLGGNFCIVYD